MDISNNSRVIKAGVGYSVGNVLIRGLSFLTLPIFTRLMSTADYGLYSTYITYENILTLVTGLGLHASLRAAKIEFRNQIDAYASAVLLLPLSLTIILTILTVPLRYQLESISSFSYNMLIILIMQAMGSSVISMYNSRISLEFAYKKYLLISLINSIMNIAISLLLILGVKEITPFYGRVLGTSMPIIVIAAALLASFFAKARPHFNTDFFRFGLRYSLPLIPHGVSQIILAQFGKIVVQQKIGNAAAGIYGFAFTIALILQILVVSLDTAWGPWFFERYEKGDTAEIRKRSSQYVSVFSLLTCILLCISPEIVQLLAAEAYWPAITIVIPALLGVYFTFLYNLPAQVEYYHKKTNYIAFGTIGAAIVNIALLLILVPIYGYPAAVYVTLATYGLYFILHIIIAARITKNKLPFDTRRLMLYASITITVAAIMQVTLLFWYIRYSILILQMIVYYRINRKYIEDYMLRIHSKHILR
ncbi:MAG: lipopolysaccharide biosynthesis protein [Christensenellales bacterium]